MHLFSGGLILDQLHDPIAQNHLSGRDGHITAHHESVSANRRLAHQLPLHIFQKKCQPPHQIGTLFLLRALQHHRIACQPVAGREHIQPLAGTKGY